MHVDDILTWISRKNVELFQSMQDNVTNDEKWNQLKGAHDILDSLRHHILTVTNPHNREDIKKYNEKKMTASELIESPLLQIDNDSIEEWGKLHDEIKSFIKSHIDNSEDRIHLLKLICEYEMLSRKRTRIYTARWLLREVN